MQNNSGIHPKGWTILVAPKEIETKTASGIITTVGEQENREKMGQIYGVLIESGPLAWNDERDGATGWWWWRKAGAVVPRAKPGDHVIFRRYSGEQFDGNDGKKYRVMLDKDIYATKDEPAGELQ